MLIMFCTPGGDRDTETNREQNGVTVASEDSERRPLDTGFEKSEVRI